MASLDALLHQISAATAASCKEPLLRVKGSSTLPAAFKLMIDNKIHSVPVEIGDEKYAGFIDQLDLLTFAVKAYKEMDAQFEHVTEEPIYEVSSFFAAQPIAEIANFSKHDNFVQLDSETTSLHDAIKAMVELKAHRLALFTRGRLSSILSQSAVVRFLRGNAALAPLLSKSLEELGCYSSPAIVVDESSSGMQCFELMMEANVSSLAVVDKDGRVKASVSDSDLKGMRFDSSFFSALFSPVPQFLVLAKGPAAQSIIVASKSDTLGAVVERLCAAKIHRMPVIEEGGRPVGMISLSDVLAVVLKHAKPAEALPSA